MPKIQFSAAALTGMRCVQLVEPHDNKWSSPYLCVPQKSWYQFTWEKDGVHGKTNKRCMKFKLIKAKDNDWCNNYLCAQEKSDGKGKFKI